MGYVHVGFMKIHVSTGEVALLNGFERMSKFAFGLIEARVCAVSAGAFVHKLVDQVPFQTHTIQTSDDSLFVETDQFSRACRERGIMHRVIATSHSDHGTDDPSARIALEGPGYDFETIQELQNLLAQRVDDYNRSCRLKSLGGSTPAEYAAQHCRQTLRRSVGASQLPG
jgi:transposase InsO family protein